MLAILYASAALVYLHSARLADGDVWWHLATARWIVAHHAVPYTDPFSREVFGRPWQAYSWLFDLLILPLYQRLGLCGLVALPALLATLITAAIYRMVARLCADFSIAVLVTFVAALAMSRLYTTRPWLFTILFFVWELDILLQVRRSGRHALLLWLLPLFALWANLHIQFIDGLLVLALAAAESLAGRWWPPARTRVELQWMLTAVLGVAVATLLNPYGARLYKTAYELAAQAGVMNKIEELLAIPFRAPADYCALALALGAAAALGTTKRLPVFETALLGVAALLSFRSQRDVWLIAIVAAAVLAQTFGGSFAELSARATPSRKPSRVGPRLGLILGSLLVLGGGRIFGVGNGLLASRLAEDMPVSATEFARAHRLPGPIFNTFSWGGYLIFQLRRPVSLDGRAALYGDPRLDRSVATWSGAPDWASDAMLGASGLVIAPVGAPLTQLLRLDPRFRVMYEDKTAAVFAGVPPQENRKLRQ